MEGVNLVKAWVFVLTPRVGETMNMKRLGVPRVTVFLSLLHLHCQPQQPFILLPCLQSFTQKSPPVFVHPSQKRQEQESAAKKAKVCLRSW